MSIISVKGLSKSFGDTIVFQDVSTEIEKGEAVFIIGASGCGKSTFLRCLNRLNVPDAGEVLINGVNIHAPGADLPGIRRTMGMVYQQFNLFSHLTVLENVILAPMKVAGVSQTDAVREAREYLRRVGMGGREDAMPSSLSGGQKQRVAIARALAMHPEVMLFDEPTSALDPTMVHEVEEVIRTLCNEGMTSVIVTHEMSFVKNTASRVLFFAEHGIYEQGTPEAIFQHPQKALTKQFLYRSHMLEKTLDARHLDLYSFESELTRFMSNYDSTRKNRALISQTVDELLVPVFGNAAHPAQKADVRLHCSESGSSHVLTVTFFDITGDPLEAPYLDTLNVQLLEHNANFVFSKEVENGWQVCIQM